MGTVMGRGNWGKSPGVLPEGKSFRGIISREELSYTLITCLAIPLGGYISYCIQSARPFVRPFRASKPKNVKLDQKETTFWAEKSKFKVI